MPMYRCLVSSVNGLRKTEIYRPDDDHSRQLVARGIVEEITPEPEAEPEKPKRKRKPKGGDDAQAANPDETIEYKGDDA